MTLSDDLANFDTVFIDTAPFIYFIQAHELYNPITTYIFDEINSGNIIAYSSVITLTEVLPKPIENGDERLARKFAEFLKHGKNLTLIEISEDIAEFAGKLRGRYPFLKTIDAIQISAAINTEASVFLSNDKKLKQIREIKVMLLSDYL